MCDSVVIRRTGADPKFFHIEDGDEIFCGTARIDWPHFDPVNKYCRRCNLQYARANSWLAEEILNISYADLTIEDMAALNEVLAYRPSLRGKELLRTAYIEHVRCLQDIPQSYPEVEWPQPASCCPAHY